MVEAEKADLVPVLCLHNVGSIEQGAQCTPTIFLIPSLLTIDDNLSKKSLVIDQNISFYSCKIKQQIGM